MWCSETISTNSPFIWRFTTPHELLKHSEFSLKTVQLPCTSLLLWTLVAVWTSLWDWLNKQGWGCILCFNNCCPSFSGWMGSTAQVAELWAANITSTLQGLHLETSPTISTLCHADQGLGQERQIPDSLWPQISFPWKVGFKVRRKRSLSVFCVHHRLIQI